MENRKEFIKRIQEKVTLVAVSKNRSREQIEQLYHDGITFFGENKVQQLISKA
ncbi:MAG: YggS family pyridoxal phosphate-dependent enzyme, partial [Firmicutes bacterium HGW-Firmicutes-10]